MSSIGKRRLAAAGTALSALLTVGTLPAEPALKQSQIKGLLVVQLGDGSVAGTAEQMNATVVSGPAGSFGIGFNQPVGNLMKAATDEVEKFIRVRHGDKLPIGHRVELAFSDKYSPKDGPSAAVPCALLLDSIITGDEIDPDFAATGDMTATGEVRLVGGIVGKIRGASKKRCKIIGLPAPNKQSVSDLYIMKGIKPLYKIQVFSMESFDQARALAVAKREKDLQQAIDEFELVQKALTKNEKYITNAKVQTKLKEIVGLAPNHLSARILYLHSIRKGPAKLSLAGSIMAIDEAATSFAIMLDDGSFIDTERDDVLRNLVFELGRLRPMLDPRTKDYFDAYEELIDYVKEIRARRIFTPQIGRQLKTLSRRVVSEETELLNDEEVQEELMFE